MIWPKTKFYVRIVYNVLTKEVKMNTILFDLDGTLLPMDTKKFENIYFQELCLHFKDIIPKDKLINYVWQSTAAMVNNSGLKTNEEVFYESFGNYVGGNIQSFIDEFNTFYDTSFLKVRESVNDVAAIQESVRILKEKGYNLVVATNPLFPEKAIFQRIRWAGFNVTEFSYVSTFEKNHYCKPQLNYYKEILKDIGRTPEECLMVGNDVQEDLVAGKLGIKTFLIKDNILHRTDDEILCDYMGSYADFLSFINTLPDIN